MKKRRTFILPIVLVLALSFLTACADAWTPVLLPVPEQAYNDLEGVSLVLTDLQPQGASTFTIVNKSPDEITYSGDAYLHVWKDGQWLLVEPGGFREPLFIIPPGEEGTIAERLDYMWFGSTGKRLPSGRYRYVKPIDDTRREKHFLACEFEV